MKHEKLLTILTAAALAFFTAWGAVGCIISAFGLTLEHAASPVLVCGLFSLLAAVLFSFRYGGTALLCLLALACGYVYHDGRAAEQFWLLLHRLTTVYDRAYGWGVLQITDAAWDAGFVDWPLGIVGAVIAMTAARCVCRRKSVWGPVLATVLPLCTCIVVTDTVPGEGWLMMVMAGLILLILTSPVRRENALQGLRLTAWAALPVVVALTVLFHAVPQKDYVNQSEILRENILIAVQNIPKLMETGMNQLASGLRSQPQKQVDLAGLGARIPFTYPVMEVTAETSGTLYLREQDYDQYDGFGWTSTESREELFSRSTGPGETVTIRTLNRKSIQFLPYYPGEETALTGGCVENPDGTLEYTILRNDLPENWRQTAYQASSGSEEWQAYCSLPDAAAQGAAELLAGLYSDGASNTEKADIIAAYVTNSAAYDLDPGKMPAGEPDFALWFLLKGESGYCVHFATAAAVLLRAAGIPARYVTGYMVETTPGQTVTATEENAHAWAEYYEPNLGLWIPLEATPAEETAVEARPHPAATEATRPEDTEPTVTEAVTQETVPQTTVPSSAPTDAPNTSEASEIPEVPTEAEPTPEEPSLPLLYLLFLPGLALALAAQRSLRLNLRRRQQRTGDPNKQALRRWRESVRLARLLKESPTEELIVLAQKAKFSQYELTQEELLLFDSFNRTCLRRLKERPWYLRVIYQYVYAAY